MTTGSHFASLFGPHIKSELYMKALSGRKYGLAKYSFRMVSVGLYSVLTSFFPFEEYMAD